MNRKNVNMTRAERKSGRSKLVYDKATRTIIPVGKDLHLRIAELVAEVERLRGKLAVTEMNLGDQCRDGRATLLHLIEQRARAEAAGAERDAAVAALKDIETLKPRPFEKFPDDWKSQIAQCPECQRYKGHPIQQGICDEHRQPLYAREKHTRFEAEALGYRMRIIARESLAAHDGDRR